MRHSIAGQTTPCVLPRQARGILAVAVAHMHPTGPHRDGSFTPGRPRPGHHLFWTLIILQRMQRPFNEEGERGGVEFDAKVVLDSPAQPLKDY